MPSLFYAPALSAELNLILRYHSTDKEDEKVSNSNA
jgi:hypothetical protein